MSTTYDIGAEAPTIISEIEKGCFDADLAALGEAVTKRKQQMEAGWRDAIQVGFEVRIKDFVSPRYYRGATGTVKRIEYGRRTNSLYVEFNVPVYDSRGRKHNGTLCRPSLLEPAE